MVVKSALNPLLWFCAVVDLPVAAVIVFIYKTSPLWLLIGLFIIFCIPIVTLVFSAIFLLFFDRDKLQSEDYQIRKKTLDLIGQKGDSVISLVANAVVNPKYDELLPGRAIRNKEKKK